MPSSPKKSTNKNKNNPNKAAGIIMLICGAYAFSLASGLVPENKIHAPMIIIWLATFVFFAASSLVLMQEHTQKKPIWREIMAALILVAMGIMAAWASIYGADFAVKTNLGSSQTKANPFFAKILFGFGAVTCWGLSVWAIKRALNIWKRDRHSSD